MVRMSNMEQTQVQMEEKIDDLKKSFDDLAKKILLWLSIAGALIGLLQFLGPSIRKTLGMNESSAIQVTAQLRAKGD